MLKHIPIDFKNPECLINIGSINPLAHTLKKYYNFDKEKEKEMKDKFNLLNPYIYNCRSIFWRWKLFL